MKQVLSKLVIIASGLLFAGFANANTIVIDEYFIEQGVGEFAVTNGSDQEINLFAVGTNDANYAEYRQPADEIYLGWEGTVVNRESWDNFSPSFYLGRDINVYANQIGSFDSLFSGYSSAIVFFVNLDWEATQSIAPGSTASGFTFFSGELASPFVATDGFGNIIETGETIHVSSVPVPAAAWLFGSGLLGLVGIARRKQS